MQEFGGIRDKRRVFAMDSMQCENGGATDVGVSMFEVRADSGDKRFEKLKIPRNFLKETECCTANIFVGMLLGW